MEQNKITTEFTYIDEKIDGLKKSDLICVASRPVAEDRKFILNIVNNIAKQQKSALLFSINDNKGQVINEIINIVCATSTNIQETMKELTLLDENIYIYDNVVNITDIEQTSRKAKLQENIDLIIIDYLQLIKSDGATEEVIIRLKTLAEELNVPVILLCQLSEKISKPKILDLKYSSIIEKYADIIMLVYREDYYNKNSEKKYVAEVIISKKDEGNLGTVELLDIKNKYVNLAR